MLDALSPSRRPRIVVVLVAVVVIGVAVGAWFARTRIREPISFSNDIQPILNQNCVQCHGGVRQKNGVSFVFQEDALGKGKSGRRTIVPGHPDESELIARVSSSDPETRMPYHAPPLSPQQIKLLRQWIKEGAKWEDHWAFVAPEAAASASGEAVGLGASTAGPIYSRSAGERRTGAFAGG